jgi:hypothetical protein
MIYILVLGVRCIKLLNWISKAHSLLWMLRISLIRSILVLIGGRSWKFQGVLFSLVLIWWRWYFCHFTNFFCFFFFVFTFSTHPTLHLSRHWTKATSQFNLLTDLIIIRDYNLWVLNFTEAKWEFFLQGLKLKFANLRAKIIFYPKEKQFEE